MLTILEACLVLWHHLLRQFRHLGVTFGALWMHFSCQKTDWGAKVAPRGATAIISYHIWAPFGSYFLHIFVLLMQTVAYLKHVAYFLQFWIALSDFGERLICNPYTAAQSKHTFQLLHVFLKQAPQRVQNVFILS